MDWLNVPNGLNGITRSECNPLSCLAEDPPPCQVLKGDCPIKSSGARCPNLVCGVFYGDC